MRRRELTAWMLSLVLVPESAVAQIVLSEIMFRAPVSDAYEEFIELHNSSATEWVDLSACRIGNQSEMDGLVDCGHGFRLPPKGFALILDPGYWGGSTVYDAVIDQEALLLTIDDGSFGVYGFSNSPPDTVKVADHNGIVIASHAYSTDNLKGYSEEKIRLNGGDSPNNWANSLTYLGTPGFINSVQPPSLDLAVIGIAANPSPLPWNALVHLSSVVCNMGLEITSGGEVAFLLLNQYSAAPDSILGAAEFPCLNPADSTLVALPELHLPPGPKRIAALHSLQDANPENDSLSLLLLGGYPPETLIINEFMAHPKTNSCEWVELYNPSFSAVNLQAFALSNADTMEKTQFTDTAFWVEPSGYALLARDSAIFSFDIPPDVPVFLLQTAWRSLNNGGDWIVLFDAAREVQDLVDYFNWTISAGQSLERVLPAGMSSDPQNWRLSADSSGGTPGRINSSPPPPEPVPDEFSFCFEPDPFDPDRHGSLRIRIQAPPNVASASVLAFDLRGRRLKLIFDEQITAGSRECSWNGRDSEDRRLSPGLYILSAEFRDAGGVRRECIKRTLVIAGKL